jgi:hypothetical protein
MRMGVSYFDEETSPSEGVDGSSWMLSIDARPREKSP